MTQFKFKLDDLPEHLREQAEAQLAPNAPSNRPAIPSPNVEPTFSNAPLATQEAPRFDSPVRVRIHSIRKRLTDSDGVSGKAAIDGITHARVWEDDSPKFVQEVSYSQEKASKGEAESTIITIETVA